MKILLFLATAIALGMVSVAKAEERGSKQASLPAGLSQNPCSGAVRAP